MTKAKEAPTLFSSTDEDETDAPQALEGYEPAPKRRGRPPKVSVPTHVLTVPESASPSSFDYSAIEGQVAEGAVKGIIIPGVTAHAKDWGDVLGRAAKTAMESSPNGVRVDKLTIERSFDGSYYTVEIKVQGHPPGTASFATDEIVHCATREPKKLGKWLRRQLNVVVGRKREL